MTQSDGIIVEQLNKTYRSGKVKALDGLSLKINEGEVFGLIGPNGAGKTTFFGCLLAFLKLDSGSIKIDGMQPDALAVRRKVGYLPERLNFDKWMTGKEFLHYHYDLAKQPASDRRTVCEELLSTVGLEAKAWALPVRRYSRGMLQRLGFAQALIGNPKYLLLDEPASGVDPSGVLLLRNLLRNLKSKGVTIVMNSHQLDQVEKICDRVAFIKAGQVQALENLNEVSTADLRLLVRWKQKESGTDQDLSAIAAEVNVETVESDAHSAVFLVPDTDAISNIIKLMVLKDFAIIQATSQDNRLEKFFTGSKEQESK